MALLAEARIQRVGPGADATAPASAGLRHLPGLDGLRGLAVLGVVAFHLGWIDGGYLGVDAFFVLSGFLITTLLLAEHERRGRIDLGRFWGRRARRLLPAMLAMVAFVLVWAMVADPAQVDAIRGDAIATVLYVANWHEIATTSSYWAIFDAPSPLQHTWSLAIEEQFYVVWPLVVGAAVVLAGRRRRLGPVLGVGALAAAAGSYVLMAALYDDGDASRAYFGTGSRLGAIVLGAALAALFGTRLLAPERRAGDKRLDAAALGALALLGGAWLTLSGTTPWLYRGGFAMLGLAVVVVIAAACRPGVVAKGLGWAPLRAVGTISYGLYLWHWVVIAILTESRTGLHGLALDVAQLTVSVGAALVSYWCIEQPIRTRRWLRSPGLACGAALGASGAVLALAWATVLVPGPDLDGLEQRLVADTAVTTTPAVREALLGTGRAVPPTGAAPTTVVAPLPPPRIGVFGDSTAVRTGAGLEAYGRRTGAFEVVVNDARVGCGVDQGGLRRFLGETFELHEFCGDLAQAWAQAVAAHPVDVAVIQTGMWETVERRLPGDATWRAVGDPIVDAHVAAELRAANDFWAQRGIPVVWLRNAGPDDPARRPGTMERFNELLAAVVPEFPTATEVPLDAFLDGLSDADLSGLRPDGIHFSADTSVLVADTWLGHEVADAAERLRRAGHRG